jgi:hypothetical protein
MLSGRAFRAQLVTQGQRELYDFWLEAAGSRPMPARSDIDPFKVPKLLPSLGLIDVADGLDDARFRLAGTRLHDVYGEEITGKRVDRVFAGTCAAYWRNIHGAVVEHHTPRHGIVRGPAEGRDHILLFWMRLPLSEDGEGVDRILCYDTLPPTEALRSTTGPALRQAAAYQRPAWAAPRRAAYCG